MKTEWIITIAGVVIGALAGWLYWKYVGCASGTCMITSKPLNITLYGALLGALLFNAVAQLSHNESIKRKQKNMITMIKNLFGLGPKVDVQQLIKNGAVIVDVRSEQEFASGHVKGSINIPLNILPQKTNKLPKDKPILTCCASGMRSAAAKNILMQKGFTEVYNAGSWANL